MSPDQKRIIDLLKNGGTITKKEVVALIGSRYYCNAAKHVGDMLSRMVNCGILKRVKPGVFAKGQKIKGKTLALDPKQINLF